MTFAPDWTPAFFPPFGIVFDRHASHIEVGPLEGGNKPFIPHTE